MKTFMIILSFLLFKGVNNDTELKCLNTKLLGEWYNIQILFPQHSYPMQKINGLSFTPEKDVRALHLEAKTGKIIRGDVRPLGKIICADDGKIIFEYFATPVMAVDTLSYSFESDLLIIEGRPLAGTYRNTFFEEKVAIPVTSEWVADIDGERYRNLESSSRIPSAYFLKGSERRLSMASYFPMGRYSHSKTEIEIEDFEGPGVYRISKGQGRLVLIADDAITQYETVSENSGSVIIEHCDSKLHFCTGTFELEIYLFGSQNQSGMLLQIEGKFILPVYTM